MFRHRRAHLLRVRAEPRVLRQSARLLRLGLAGECCLRCLNACRAPRTRIRRRAPRTRLRRRATRLRLRRRAPCLRPRRRAPCLRHAPQLHRGTACLRSLPSGRLRSIRRAQHSRCTQKHCLPIPVALLCRFVVGIQTFLKFNHFNCSRSWLILRNCSIASAAGISCSKNFRTTAASSRCCSASISGASEFCFTALDP